MLTKLGLLYTPNYGASNGIRTRIFCMASRNTNHYTIPAYGAGEGIQTLSHSITSRVRYRCATPAEKEKEFGEQFQSHAFPMDFTALFRQQVGRSTAGRHGVGPPSVPMLGIPIVLVTFNTCLRTHGPRYRIRTGPICLEGRDACR